MYEVRLDLARVASTALAPRRSWRRDLVTLAGVALTCLVAVALFSTGWPLVSMGFLAIASITMAMAESRDRQGELMPELIASEEVRELYRAILVTFEELDRTIDEAPRPSSTTAQVRERARAAIAAAGRLAMLSNPLTEYVCGHDANYLRVEIDRLQGAVATAGTAETAGALARACAARTQQLAAHVEMTARGVQICARLEALHASLEATIALIVKLQVVDEDQRTGASEQLAEAVGGLSEGLDDLATLDHELAA
jgi:hypothetical protein